MNPPVPEGMHQMQHQGSSVVSADMSILQESISEVEVNKKEEEMIEPEIRQEYQRKDEVQKKVDAIAMLKTDEVKEKCLKNFEALSVLELQKMQEEEWFKESMFHSMPMVMQVQKKNDAIEDETLKMAKNNIDMTEAIVGEL